MLQLIDVNKTFNPGTVNENHAIKDFSVTINDNDYISVIGGNGAGKILRQNETLRGIGAVSKFGP